MAGAMRAGWIACCSFWEGAAPAQRLGLSAIRGPSDSDLSNPPPYQQSLSRGREKQSAAQTAAAKPPRPVVSFQRLARHSDRSRRPLPSVPGLARLQRELRDYGVTITQTSILLGKRPSRRYERWREGRGGVSLTTAGIFYERNDGQGRASRERNVWNQMNPKRCAGGSPISGVSRYLPVTAEAACEWRKIYARRANSVTFTAPRPSVSVNSEVVSSPSPQGCERVRLAINRKQNVSASVEHSMRSGRAQLLAPYSGTSPSSRILVSSPSTGYPSTHGSTTPPSLRCGSWQGPSLMSRVAKTSENLLGGRSSTDRAA
ncbi:hypothetical protein NA57DRAFT_61730 [Rhizodiscina lignyota]|uniref:Uncharacterized protein n=1 Tax=Rhizodiscina lignyota TaxID=1504668 RepID=A0A9P4I698_9PEZI|nr:hypothetical protein NA57DRAFT_61730 [Rhizodiscina lignyota]